MTRKKLRLAVAIALGIVSMVAASSAWAFCGFGCTCSVSCDTVCRDGPFVQDCPECNLTTCGEWGVCDSLCPGPDCDWTTTLYGTNNADTLNGTSANDRIFGYDGDDTIYGHAGDDTVYAGNGNDTVYGGSGDDCLYGEGGNDQLDPQTGSADYADGGPGTDTCYAEVEINCEL